MKPNWFGIVLAVDALSDDKSISTLEFDGVELAAIQGLNRKLEETRAENAELKREIGELKRLILSNQKADHGAQ